MSSISVVPAAPIAVTSFCKVTVAGYDQNDTGAFSASAYPTEPEIKYYLTFEKGGAILGKSYVFGVDENGGHVFNNYVFPSSGSWTVRLSKASNDSSVATQSVTVS